MTTRDDADCPDCRELLAVLSEYLDGELPPDACDHLESHVEGCGRCERFIESLRRTVAILRDTRPPSLPDDVKREIVEAYRKLSR